MTIILAKWGTEQVYVMSPVDGKLFFLYQQFNPEEKVKVKLVSTLEKKEVPCKDLSITDLYPN